MKKIISSIFLIIVVAMIALIDIKKRNDTNVQVKCCVLLLLDSKREFNHEFQKLNSYEQEEFKGWPIWNLYNNK